MIEKIKSAYRNIIPFSIRVKIYFLLLGFKNKKQLNNLLENVSSVKLKPEIQERVNWLKKNTFTMIPYDFIKEYKKSIKVEYDSERCLYYVFWKNKKMYWKRGVSPNIIASNVNAIFIEQDVRSPHCYLQKGDWYPQKDAIVADIGAAEGDFALDIIELVSKVYLFESDPAWIEALQATFSPWKEKVEIVKNYVGNGKGYIRLDDYFTKKKIDFIKADIEGSEISMLLGGRETFTKKVQQTLICAYHRSDDEENIRSCLEMYGFNCEMSDGYLCFHCENGKDFPLSYFRHGLVYGKRI